MAAKKIKVKTKTGKLIDFPTKHVKKIMNTAGFTGKLLIKTTEDVFKESKKVAKTGIISATNLEKTIVKTVNNTNKKLMNNAQKITKKVLK